MGTGGREVEEMDLHYVVEMYQTYHKQMLYNLGS